MEGRAPGSFRCSAHVLRFSHLQPVGEEEDVGFIDPVTHDILKEVGVDVPGGYGIVRPTARNVEVSLLGSDKPEVYEISLEEESLAISMVLAMFSHMKGRFRKIAVDNIELVASASGGFPYRISKEDFVWCHAEYVRWYCETGNTNRPDPIWKQNPKVEYMVEEKIEEGKIRIFRNPPMDYLALEKCYFQTMDNAFVVEGGTTWSRLGFSKEEGGWHSLFTSIAARRYKFKWDVGKWDKSYGPRLDKACELIRRNWFAPLEKEEESDLDWLAEQATYSYELRWHGWLSATALSQKSGRLKTSTNNTIAHIFIIFIHYIRTCRRLGVVPTFDHAISIYTNAVYSDDIVGGTDEVAYVEEQGLRETYALFGMELKEYLLTESVHELDFLGARCGSFQMGGRSFYVPEYNTDRMMFAILVQQGRLSNRLRAERIIGLYHNLAFSPRAETLDYLVQSLISKGLWPEDLPRPSLEHVRRQYMAAEGRA
nr:RNA-dependent RNA polymerase [Flumine Astrovirus 10]